MNSSTRLVKPQLVIFDVNETLSNLAPLADRFVDLGALASDASAWFAGLLRDGFALTSIGENPDFAELATGSLRVHFAHRSLNRDLGSAIDFIMEGFSGLGTHPDVGPGLRAIAETDATMITLSNGSSRIAEEILEREDLTDLFEHMLSVSDAERWKPAAEAYEYALERCGIEAADALMVAVHPWDLAGADAVGMQTAWIDRKAEPYPDYFETPTWVGSSLTRLAEALASA